MDQILALKKSAIPPQKIGEEILNTNTIWQRYFLKRSARFIK